MGILTQHISKMFEKRYMLIFVLLLSIVYWFVHIFHVIPLRPQGIHQWAMCDRAAVARNYAEESMNFFKPRTNYTLEGDGVTGIEFPIINYCVAILYRVFGFHEWFYRVFSLLVISIGLCFAFLFTVKLVHNKWLGMCLIFLWMLSPTLNYYMPSFIPDTASLGFILIAWYFIFKYIKSSGQKYIYLFCLFAGLATLIKITSLITVMTVVFLAFIDSTDYFKSKNQGKHLFRDKRYLFGGILALLLAVSSWYFYSGVLNKHASFAVFTMNIHPIFDVSLIKELLPQIASWFRDYHSALFFYFLAATIPVWIFFWRKANRLYSAITILLYSGAICFFILMLFQFVEHDYYIIALLSAHLFHLITFVDLLDKLLPGRLIYYVVAPILTVLVLYEAQYSRLEQINRYEGSRADQGVMMDFRKFYNIESFMRENGIQRDDKVLVIADPSLNISLYFMNVKGYTLRWEDRQDSLARPFNHHVKYVILRTSEFKPNDQYKKYFEGSLVAEYQGIKILKPKY